MEVWARNHYDDALENIREEMYDVFADREPVWGKDKRHWSSDWDESSIWSAWVSLGLNSRIMPSARYAADRPSLRWEPKD